MTNVARQSVDPTVAQPDRLATLRKSLTRGTVGWSAEAERIFKLPRRPPPDLKALAKEMTARLKKPEGTQELRELQAWVLWEAPLVGGVLANLAIGAGKTLLGLLMPMVWPGCRRAVLLIPAKLRVQMFEHDLDFYGQHWVLPNIAGGSGFVSGRPVLHVVTYSEVSNPATPDLLEQINPDLLLGDEIHRIKNYSAALTKRTMKFLARHENVPLCGWTGTPTSDSIRDFSHISAAILRDGSPVPFTEPALGEWASALDPNGALVDPGVLKGLCIGGESVRSGFRRRLVETAGVIAGAEDVVGTELTFYEKPAPPVPERILECLRMARAQEPRRPDGEVLVTRLDEARCLRQLATGCYSRWRFPRGEPDELILQWFSIRQMWSRELREKIKQAEDRLDTDRLCRNAAERFLTDGCPGCDRKAREPHKRGCREAATHPLWESFTWAYWRDIENKVFHETEVVWENDFLLQDAAAWALDGIGIVWVENVEFGHQLAKLTKLPYYGEGEAAARGAAQERGKRSVILSINANSEGLNLQKNNDGSERFSRNLFVTPPSNAKIWGQAVGRTHRPGQVADEVEVYYYAHTRELAANVGAAREKAAYAGETWDEHKLQQGTWVPLKKSPM